MKNVWSIIALILVIIGGLNWMVVGIFNFNVVDWVFAMVPWLATVVYILVGLAAIYMIVWLCFAGSARRAKKDYSYSNKRLKKYDRKRSYFFVQTLDKAAEKVYIRIKLKFFGAR